MDPRDQEAEDVEDVAHQNPKLHSSSWKYWRNTEEILTMSQTEKWRTGTIFTDTHIPLLDKFIQAYFTEVDQKEKK